MESARVFYGGIGVEYDHRTILKVLGVLPGSSRVVSRLRKAYQDHGPTGRFVFPCTLGDLVSSELDQGFRLDLDPRLRLHEDLAKTPFDVLVDIEGDSSYVFPRGSLARNDIGSATIVRSVPSDEVLRALKVLGSPQVIIGCTFEDLPDLSKMTQYVQARELTKLQKTETKARSTFARCLKIIDAVPSGESSDSEDQD